MTEPERWIVIVRWDDFQHPDATRSGTVPWIKNYTRQLSDESYLGLTFHQRGVLHGLRLEYARARRQLRDSTVALTRRLGQRVTTRDLEALNHAGFIEFSASKPASNHASTPASLDKSRREKEVPTSREPSRARPPQTQNVCPICTVECRNNLTLHEHLETVHWLEPDQIASTLKEATP